jgi:hypothetical protein
MPAKFPSAKRLLYTTGALTHTSWTNQDAVSLPKDLSIVNRRGYQSTDDKGVPYVYLCQIDMYRVNKLTTPDGLDNPSGRSDAVLSSDFSTALSIQTVENNWATKNAAIKWHQARDAMWKKAGVKKNHLGAYSKGVRYNWDAADQSWNSPLDGFSSAYAGGTWDSSVFVDPMDTDYQLKLIGNGVDESTAQSIAVLNYVHSYLQSRATVPVDSNLESDDTPAAFNHLASLMRAGSETNFSSLSSDDVVVDAKTGQDNPPYDQFVSADTQNDITEPTEAGRSIMGIGAGGMASMLVEIPFGIFQARVTHYGSTAVDENSPIEYSVKVLDIYPMQG